MVAKPDRTIRSGVSPLDVAAPLVRSPVPAFRFTGVIPLFVWPRLSHSTPDTPVPGEAVPLHKLDCMHEPRSVDYHAFKANCTLDSNL